MSRDTDYETDLEMDYDGNNYGSILHTVREKGQTDGWTVRQTNIHNIADSQAGQTTEKHADRKTDRRTDGQTDRLNRLTNSHSDYQLQAGLPIKRKKERKKYFISFVWQYSSFINHWVLPSSRYEKVLFDFYYMSR